MNKKVCRDCTHYGGKVDFMNICDVICCKIKKNTEYGFIREPHNCKDYRPKWYKIIKRWKFWRAK